MSDTDRIVMIDDPCEETTEEQKKKLLAWKYMPIMTYTNKYSWLVTTS